MSIDDVRRWTVVPEEQCENYKLQYISHNNSALRCLCYKGHTTDHSAYENGGVLSWPNIKITKTWPDDEPFRTRPFGKLLTSRQQLFLEYREKAIYAQILRAQLFYSSPAPENINCISNKTRYRPRVLNLLITSHKNSIVSNLLYAMRSISRKIRKQRAEWRKWKIKTHKNLPPQTIIIDDPHAPPQT